MQSILSLRSIPSAILIAASTAVSAQIGSLGANNPFGAPDATIHYAPNRMYDLQNLSLDFNLDYPNRLLTATSTNTISSLRDGTTQLRFHANEEVQIGSVSLNGNPATFKRDAEGILVDCPPTKAGEKDTVEIHYTVHGSAGGWHWNEPKKNDPSKIGAWTNGETSDTRDWAVTWDYPNDFTTSETRTTVPADWEVISNGTLISDKLSDDKKTRTVYWKMDQPHATYLTSIVAGPFDIKTDEWRGIPLYYVSPKGQGNKLDYTFAHTKDMLSFFSDNIGVKYPWTKYAQDCEYDFPGGQENVTCTTLGQAFLTDPRDGYYTMDSLNSHEMGHQWFGDYVTCKDWGQIWLNESFAVFMDMSYTVHSLGINAAQREFEANSQAYLGESHRYQRPLATNFYMNPDVMFDHHTYEKGGALLMSLRSLLGSKLFYSGLKLYFERFHNGPAETNDLCEAMSDATGVNLHRWFDQWILKPGHPVIDWSWKWDAAAKQVTVHMKQTQDTKGGAPIYDIPTKVGLLYANGKVMKSPIRLKDADQSFTIAADAKPDAVVFDADQDFVREIPTQPWATTELLTIARLAPNCVDRQAALESLLRGSPTDADVDAILKSLESDKGLEPAIVDTSPLAALKRPALRPFWIGELRHESFLRRTDAVRALALLPKDEDTDARLRDLVNDTTPYAEEAAAIDALAKLDYAKSEPMIRFQATTSQNDQVRGAALNALVSNNAAEANDLVFASLAETESDKVRTAGFMALAGVKSSDPRIVQFVRKEIQARNFATLNAVIRAAVARRMKEVVPDLKDFIKAVPQASGPLKQVMDLLSS